MQFFLIILIIIIFVLLSNLGTGIIFKKIGLDFSKGIIPFYNKIILIKKFKLPSYHILLIFIPIIRIYTNYLINIKICEKTKKESIETIKLTLFPYICNITFGLLLEEKEKPIKIKKQINPDEYMIKPRPPVAKTIYRASKPKTYEELNVNHNEEIIDEKKPSKVNKKYTKICPKCGSNLPENIDTCFVCGTKL